MYLMDVYLVGVYLVGVYLVGVYLVGVYLVSMYLMGVYLVGVYLVGMHLTKRAPRGRAPHWACASLDAHLLGMHLTGCTPPWAWYVLRHSDFSIWGFWKKSLHPTVRRLPLTISKDSKLSRPTTSMVLLRALSRSPVSAESVATMLLLRALWGS
jgi:hypothetical protein